MDKFELISFLAFIITIGIITIILHNVSSAFDYTKILYENGEIKQLPWDVILDCDSQRVIDNSTSYLEGIRHPLISVVASLDYIFAKIGSLPFSNKNQMIATIFSIFNILRLALSGLIIKRLINSKLALVLFYISFSTILYSFVLEYHTYALFFILLFVFIYLNDDENFFEKTISLFLTFSSNFIMVAIMPVCIKFKNLKKYIMECIKIGLGIMYLVTLYGKLLTVISLEDATNTEHIAQINLMERINRYTSFIKNGICNVIPQINEYSSYYIENSLSWLGVAILLICLFVFIKYKKDKLVVISSYWILISIIIFPIIGFSYYSYSTHSVLFTWTYIILISKFIQYLYETKINKKILFIMIAFIIAYIITTNCMTFTKLFRYAMKFNYLT